MSDVFISYSREDAAQAERIARGLEAMGLDVFWDNEIPPGQTWADYIETKLNQSTAAVVLWSQSSSKSQWVREEARMGRSKLIPAKLDAAEPPFGFGDVQAADLSSWGGDYNHPQWGRFANAVYAIVKGGAAPQAPPQPQPQAGGWQTPPPAPQQSQSSGWQTPPPAGGQQQSWSNTGASAGAAAGSPMEYIQKCFRLYVDGKGRARKSEFWWWILFTFIVSFIATLIDGAIGTVQVVAGVVGLAVLAPSISVMSRRLHDAGYNGWLTAAPIVISMIGGALGPLGLIFSLVGLVGTIAIGLLPGTAGPNQYGPDPKAP